jgi:hypothetical protein
MRYTIRSSGCNLEDKIIALSRNVGKRTPNYSATPVSVEVEFSRPLVLYVYTVRFRILQQHFLNSLASSLKYDSEISHVCLIRGAHTHTHT